jgi:hypothetical protein
MQQLPDQDPLNTFCACLVLWFSQVLGTTFGYCSTIMYLMARFSQILKNWERQWVNQLEGWTFGLTVVLLALRSVRQPCWGGSFWYSSIICFASPWLNASSRDTPVAYPTYANLAFLTSLHNSLILPWNEIHSCKLSGLCDHACADQPRAYPLLCFASVCAPTYAQGQAFCCAQRWVICFAVLIVAPYAVKLKYGALLTLEMLGVSYSWLCWYCWWYLFYHSLCSMCTCQNASYSW